MLSAASHTLLANDTHQLPPSSHTWSRHKDLPALASCSGMALPQLITTNKLLTNTHMHAFAVAQKQGLVCRQGIACPSIAGYC